MGYNSKKRSTTFGMFCPPSNTCPPHHANSTEQQKNISSSPSSEDSEKDPYRQAQFFDTYVMINMKRVRSWKWSLNRLLITDAHLEGPSQGSADSHPKVPNPHLVLPKKTFRGKVKLAVNLSHDCKIDSTILAKGATAGALRNDEIQKWLDDIESGRYQVVRKNGPFSNPDSDE